MVELLPILTYTFGKKRLEFRTKLITPEMSDILAHKIMQMELEGSAYERLERDPLETVDDYAKRLAEADAKDPNRKTKVRGKEETWEAYLARMFKPKSVTMERGFRLLNILASCFSTADYPVPQLEKEDFSKVIWLEVRCFIYDLLSACELDDEAAIFLPKGYLSSQMEKGNPTGAEAPVSSGKASSANKRS